MVSTRRLFARALGVLYVRHGTYDRTPRCPAGVETYGANLISRGNACTACSVTQALELQRFFEAVPNKCLTNSHPWLAPRTGERLYSLCDRRFWCDKRFDN